MDQLIFNAVYGTFDSNMLSLDVINVTDIVRNNLLYGGLIKIPSKINFNQYFGDYGFGDRKFLQIEYRDRKYNILADNYMLDIVIDLYEARRKIKLVYYIYIDRKSNWKEIISGQLRQLKSYGILDEVDLYVHITDTEDVFDDVIPVVQDVCNSAMICGTNTNHFEYHAIRLIYDLAQQETDSLFMYLHTKGMSYETQIRVPSEVALLTGTFDHWRRKIQAFENPKINKIGLYPAVEDLQRKLENGVKGGWIWYNFWYARGSYIITCEEPEVQLHRWYFEDWLGGPQNDESVTKNDCFSVHIIPEKTYYTAIEASLALKYWKSII